MKQILKNKGLEGRGLTWSQLGTEAGINAHADTIKRAIGSLNHYKYITCQRGWQSPANKENRHKFARVMLKNYNNTEE